MLTSFIEALPEKVRSAEYKDEGTRFRRKEKALAYRYVELNQLYKKFIALDIDIPGSAFLWDERGLPPPTFVIINPKNTHCHYLYELRVPVYYTEEARRAPQNDFTNEFFSILFGLVGLADSNTSFSNSHHERDIAIHTNTFSDQLTCHLRHRLYVVQSSHRNGTWNKFGTF